MSQLFFKDLPAGRERRTKKSLVIFLTILTALFVFVSVVFVREYMILRQSGIFRAHQLRNSVPFYQTGSTTTSAISRVEMIEDWMTFDYLNASFQLPQNMLRDGLHITDPHYPRMSIRRAARDRGIAREVYLLEVRAFIQEYLLSNKTP